MKNTTKLKGTGLDSKKTFARIENNCNTNSRQRINILKKNSNKSMRKRPVKPINK